MRICVNSNTFKLQGLLITGWPPNDMGNGSLRVSKRSKFSPVSNNKFNAVPYQHRRVRSSFTTAAAGDAIKIVHHGIRNPPPVPLHSSEGRTFSDGIASHCTADGLGWQWCWLAWWCHSGSGACAKAGMPAMKSRFLASESEGA